MHARNEGIQRWTSPWAFLDDEAQNRNGHICLWNRFCRTSRQQQCNKPERAVLKYSTQFYCRKWLPSIYIPISFGVESLDTVLEVCFLTGCNNEVFRGRSSRA